MRVGLLVCVGLLVVGAWQVAPSASAGDAPAPDDPMAALAFLVGEFHGEGKHPAGTYQETLTGTWILGGTALEIRSRSTARGRPIFEDRRILSHDPETERWRMRQWAEGRLRVYAGRRVESTFVFDETAQEGPAAPAWRYVFTPSEGGGFGYAVHTVVEGRSKPFVSGKLGTQLKDPGSGGGLGIRQYDAQAAGMAAQVHHPDGKGPYPLIVFSPGGSAASVQGYGPYGRWFATWGFVTVVVAFSDGTAVERAPKFTRVLDWALAEGRREGSPLHGMLDAERIAFAGHSRGGHAALVAGRSDARAGAVLALAPSGPTAPSEAAHAPKACLIIGSGDGLLAAARKAYALQTGERFFVEIEGLDHMLQPREPVLKLVRRATAFLQYALAGDARYRAPLAEKGKGLTVQAAPAGEK